MINRNKVKLIDHSGFLNGTFLICLFLILPLSGCSQSAEQKVTDVCNTYMEGRIALYKGDSTLLKSVTEANLYRLLILNHQYGELLDGPVYGPNLNEVNTESVEIIGECAVCQMSIEDYYFSEENYYINVCKEGEKWKVKGENDVYVTTDRIKAAEKKLIDRKAYLNEKPARDSVMKVMRSFTRQTKQYFKTQEPDVLNENCTQATKVFIQSLYAHAKERTDLSILAKEVENSGSAVVKVHFEKDRIVCKFTYEEINVLLQRSGNSFVISGFNGINSEQITAELIEVEYLSFLRSLRWTKSEKYRNEKIN